MVTVGPPPVPARRAEQRPGRPPAWRAPKPPAPPPYLSAKPPHVEAEKPAGAGEAGPGCREETVTGAGFVCWSPWTEEREGARPRLLRFSKWCVTQSSLSGSVKNHFQIRKWREGFLREDFRSQRK
ncbi:hypothetical protein VULLAG_LOCUS4190 [Vulpes lagopus]